MLSERDNERLTRVGPGTPMGELFRRYWLPCVLSSELPADGPPLRLRLLGEDLVAFRDSNGEVGVLEAYCPHRRALLFWGRNEECGLRCVYHGWKFDVRGRCVDMPSEPASSNFKSKVQAKAYPTRERAGLVWVYMGPGELEPDFPQYEWTLVPEGQRVVRKWFQDSNWLQSLEGDIDTAHVSFLHRSLDPSTPDTAKFLPGSRRYFALDKSPRLTVHETQYGFVYGGRRTIGPDQYYWRLTQWLAPSSSQTPSTYTRNARILVPIDDYTSFSCGVTYNLQRPLEAGEGEISGRPVRPQRIRLRDGYIIDGWVSELTRDNDYGLDREFQRTKKFSGIDSGPVDEDRAMTETMGPIVDRSKEHLGTSDVAIIAARRRLLRMLRELEQGIEPYAVRHPESFRCRSLEVVSSCAELSEVVAEHASHLAAEDLSPTSAPAV